MTGSNRLLIGVGWSMVVLLAAWRWRVRQEGAVHRRSTPRCTSNDLRDRDRVPRHRNAVLADVAVQSTLTLFDG
jgi:hypothetical protein